MNPKLLLAVGGMSVTLSLVAGSAALAQTPAQAPAHKTMAPAHEAHRAAANDDNRTLSVVATGLDNPRHLAFGPDGALYIAEAGTGGDPSDASHCVDVTGPDGAATQACVGKTGSIGRLSHGNVVPALTGLESVALQDTGETLGPSAITFAGGRLVTAMQDYTAQPDGSTLLPGGDEFAKVVSAYPGSPSYSWQLSPDLAAYAAAHPQQPGSLGSGPGETPYDSDPYDIVRYRGGFAIADAAANSVLWLSPRGRLTALAWLPATDAGQAVPTSIAVGRDGALYVGGLRGVPSAPGTADIYRIVPGDTPTVYATGLSAVTDLAFGRDGRLLALEYSTGGLLSTDPGALVQLGDDPAHTPTVLVSGLTNPTGVAVGRDGAVYIANNGQGTGTTTPSGELDVFSSSRPAGAFQSWT